MEAERLCGGLGEAERLCGGLGDLRNTENKKLTSTAKHC